MRSLIYAFAVWLISASVGHAAFGTFQTYATTPTADWVRDVTAAPYNATCNGSANDFAAFASFMTDAQAQSALGNSVMMVIPSGKACKLSSGTTLLGGGVKKFTLYAYGASLTNAGTGTILFGGEAQQGAGNGNKFSVRLATSSAGDSCVNFLYPTPSPAITVSNIVSTGSTWRLTISDSTSFTTGQIVRISGVTASNKGTLEGLQFITVVASGTPGTIDVQTPSNFQPTFSYTSGGLINDYTGLFSVGQWVLIGGQDVQAIYRSGGYGAPSNPTVYEYAQIQSINLSTGQVCFTAPLANAYKSTWPNYDVGGNLGPDPGGGATLWSLDSRWDTEFRMYGLTYLSPSGQTRMLGRYVYAQDVTDSSTPAMFPSAAGSWTGANYTAGSTVEVDKINGPVTCTNCTFNILSSQSRSSSTQLTLNNTTLNQLNGTPANTVLNNVTANTQILLGAGGYGTSSSLTGSNVSAASLDYISVGAQGAAGLQAEPGYSISGDTISIVQSTVPNAPAWAVEGSYVCWYGSRECEDIAKVIAVGQSGGSTTVKLNKSYAGSTWPAVQGGAVKIRTHPMPSFTCTSCTGSLLAGYSNGAPAGIPIYSYWSKAYDGTLGSTTQAVFRLWGKITLFSMNVTNAGGSATFALSEFNNWPIIAPAFTGNTWNSSGGGPKVNAAIGGNRTITLSGTYSVAGTQTGDVGFAAADASFMWLPGKANSGPKYSSAPAGCPGVSCPSVTITIQTDTGIP